VPVVFRNPGQEHLAEQFASSFSRDAVRLPRVPFDIEAAVLERCHAVVTGGFGPDASRDRGEQPVLALFTFTGPEAVRPEDCLFVACSQEDCAVLDERGRPRPNADLPVESFVYARYEELEDVISGAAGEAKEDAGC